LASQAYPEETYYANGTNLVTSRRIIAGGVEYLLDGVRSVRLATSYPPEVARKRALVFLIWAAALILFWFLRNRATADVRSYEFLSLVWTALVALAALVWLASMVWNTLKSSDPTQKKWLHISVKLAVVLLFGLFVFVTQGLAPGSGLVAGSLVLGLAWLKELDRHAKFSVQIDVAGRMVNLPGIDDRAAAEQMVGQIRYALVRRAPVR
jgi:hypothetical protein